MFFFATVLIEFHSVIQTNSLRKIICVFSTGTEKNFKFLFIQIQFTKIITRENVFDGNSLECPLFSIVVFCEYSTIEM